MAVRTYSAQKAGLTRAIKKGHAAVIEETVRTLKEWGPAVWPDDWSRWQRALDDTSPRGFGPSIDRLADGVFA